MSEYTHVPTVQICFMINNNIQLGKNGKTQNTFPGSNLNNPELGS